MILEDFLGEHISKSKRYYLLFQFINHHQILTRPLAISVDTSIYIWPIRFNINSNTITANNLRN